MHHIFAIFSKMSIHPLFWLVIGLAVLTGRFWEITMLFFIVWIHEMGHVITAQYFHWRIKKIELFPFGGVAEMDEHGNRPLKEELFVIVNGPLQHLWLMGGAFLLLSVGWIDSITYEMFIKFNLMILFFNLLPIWPLDGGKLVFLGLSLLYPFSVAHRYALFTSMLAVAMLMASIAVFFPFHLNFWLVLAFILYSHYVEWKQRKFAHIRFLLERYYGKSREIKHLRPIMVQDTDFLVDVFAQFCRGYKHQIILKKNDREQLTLDENELLHAYFSEKRVHGTMREIFCET